MSEPVRALDLQDIQGFILRAYRMPVIRHFVARALLGRFVSRAENDAPQITTEEEWQVTMSPGPGDNPAERPRHRPDYCLNVGITWPGLLALELKSRVPGLSFKSFTAFVEGCGGTLGASGR